MLKVYSQFYSGIISSGFRMELGLLTIVSKGLTCYSTSQAVLIYFGVLFCECSLSRNKDISALQLILPNS